MFENIFKRVTAKKIATKNGIEYIADAKGQKIESKGSFVNRVYAGKGKYIVLYPLNNVMPICPFEWCTDVDGNHEVIMDNRSSFKNITNLSEIILQMIQLYTKYIDENVVIESREFAIRLDDVVIPHYSGRATLVITEGTVCNNRIKHDKIFEAKKYFINDFLDHFIGWNFGVVVISNPELEKALTQFNNLVIEKGLREDAGPGFEVRQTKDVMHYDLKKA